MGITPLFYTDYASMCFTATVCTVCHVECILINSYKLGTRTGSRLMLKSPMILIKYRFVTMHEKRKLNFLSVCVQEYVSNRQTKLGQTEMS